MATRHDAVGTPEDQAFGRHEAQGRRPVRVLVLAFLAVGAVLAAVEVSIDLLGELSGERYAHEVFDDFF